MKELAPKRSDESLVIQYGQLPILITVQHDGIRKLSNGLLVSDTSTRLKRSRDLGTRILSKEIYDFIMTKTNGKSINRIYQRVHRSKMNHHFHQRLIKETINTLQWCCNRDQGDVLHIDLHGFSNQPTTLGEFDLILGTNHRQTVKASRVDQDLADFMTRLGYRAYLPAEKAQPGERFGATNENALVRRTAQLFPHVLSLQLEVEKQLRVDPVKRNLLATYLSDFLIAWVSGNSHFRGLKNEEPVF